MTKAISEELNTKTLVLLWELFDSIAVKRQGKMDYLQVFEIVNIGNKIKIINRQEQPSIKEELMMEKGTLNIKDNTVWIIDEPDKQIMMFPSDY